MPDSPTEERWTIEVCASCGAGPEEGDCSMECTDAKLVEVVPASQVEALQAEVERLREIGGELIEAVGWLGPGSKLRLTYSGQPDAVEDFEEAMQRLTASLFAAALSPQPEERNE